MEGERGRGGKNPISRGAERRGQPIPEPRSRPAGGGAAGGGSSPAGTERGWRGTRGREKGSEARKGSQKGGKGRERAREEGGGGQRNLRRAMCRYWELGAFRFSLGEGRGCSGLFLSCFFLPSSFSTRRHGLYFSFRNTIWGAPGVSYRGGLTVIFQWGRGGKGWGALSLSHLPVPGLGRVWGRRGNLACVFREQPEHCREFITSRTCGMSPTCCRGIGLPLPSSGGM